MQAFRIIALAGAAGSGKDTAAALLSSDWNLVKASFAGPLKRGLNAMFGWTMEQWDDREWKERVLPGICKSPRQLAQTIGTEWGRNLVNPDLWLLLARNEMYAAQRMGAGGIVFSDCRFENEARLILEMGGRVVHLSRPGIAAVSSHVSERMLPAHLLSGHIVNDGSLELLTQRLFDFVLRDYT